MRAYLNGGQVGGTELDVSPGTVTHLVALPRPVDVLNPFPDYPADSMPRYDVAMYRFSGLGFINVDGACTALIFTYKGTSNG